MLHGISLCLQVAQGSAITKSSSSPPLSMYPAGTPMGTLTNLFYTIQPLLDPQTGEFYFMPCRYSIIGA